jgi:Arc-like DNA binding domain
VRPEKKFDFLKMESNDPEFRLPKEVREELKRRATALGMTPGEYITAIVLENLDQEEPEEQKPL